VVTPEVTLFAGAATAVVLRTSIGSMTVLAGHAPFVGDVVPGEVKVEREGEPTLRMAVHGGFVQVDTSPHAADGVDGAAQGPIPGLTTRVSLLAGVAELAQDIDLARAQEALAAATDRLNQLRGGSRGDGSTQDGGATPELALAQAALLRAEVRVQIAGASVG
jgi:F-type H+-transporting ATPase subunit epsilon